MPKTALIGITVGEVAEVRIIRDAAKLAQLGIHGGKGAVEIVTKKYAKGPLSLSYKADIQRACQNSLILKKSQSPDFHKPGLCYV